MICFYFVDEQIGVSPALAMPEKGARCNLSDYPESEWSILEDDSIEQPYREYLVSQITRAERDLENYKKHTAE